MTSLEIIKNRLIDRKIEFKKLLKNLRAKSDKAPFLDEIAKEVDSVRKERYEKNAI